VVAPLLSTLVRPSSCSTRRGRIQQPGEIQLLRIVHFNYFFTGSGAAFCSRFSTLNPPKSFLRVIVQLLAFTSFLLLTISGPCYPWRREAGRNSRLRVGKSSFSDGCPSVGFEYHICSFGEFVLFLRVLSGVCQILLQPVAAIFTSRYFCVTFRLNLVFPLSRMFSCLS